MPLNLDYLIPEKYRNSDIMIALLAELEDLVGGWVDDIQGLADIINPELVSNDYMQYLADLVGTVLISSDDATEAQRRSELVQAVDWIKLKGTYQSLDVIGLMIGREFEYLDMYTNSEVNYNAGAFSLQPWFVGLSEGDNPPGLGSSYFKTPHFGVQTRLNVAYPATSTWIYGYLWIPAMFADLGTYIEKTRPIHTVPHYYILMTPECDDDGVINMVDGNIFASIIGEWTTTKVHFDQTSALGSGYGWNFDDGEFFDQSQDNFYSGITKWVLGTGSKGAVSGDSNWDSDLETPALTGTVDSITISADKVVWELIVPARTLSGISELGLYTPGTPDILRIVSMFPDINLDGNVDLRIVVTVNRV